jgi:hypothetical protein
MELNEQEFRNDEQIHHIPLEFCVGSSNRMPQQAGDRGQPPEGSEGQGVGERVYRISRVRCV